MRLGQHDVRQYQLLRRRLACENSKFEVFFDDIGSSSGQFVQDYLVVVPKVRTVNLVTGVAVLPIVDEMLGLIRIYRHPIHVSRWEIPRGFVDTGESDRISALRELEEETGLVCGDENLMSLGFLAPEPGLLAARIHLFVARCSPGDEAFSGGELGHTEFRLFSPFEVAQLISSGEMEDPCSQVACLKYALGRV